MDLKKMSTFIIFTCSIGLIFELAYLRNSFYIPMCITLNLNNEEFGWLSSIYSISAAVTYLIGGFLSDRIHSRISLFLPLFFTGIIGIIFSTIPNYPVLKILFFLMGITSIMTLFSFIVKVFYKFGDELGHGKVFGAMESGKGIIGGIIFLLMLALFNGLGGGEFGFKWIILAYSLINIILGVSVILIVPDEYIYLKNEIKISPLKQLLMVLKNKQILFLGGMVFVAYSFYGILSFFPMFFIENFDIAVNKMMLFASARYIIQILAPILAGFFADKINSSYKSMLLGLSLCFVIGILMLSSIGNKKLSSWILFLYLILNFLVYGMKVYYYSCLSEIKIDKRFIGTAIGIVACIGFSPDLFNYKMIGMWIDNGIAGYEKLMEYMIGLSLFGIMIAIIAIKRKKERKLIKKF